MEQEAGITAHIQTLGQTARITAVVTGATTRPPSPTTMATPTLTSSTTSGPERAIKLARPGGVSINFSHYTTPPIEQRP